VIVLPLFATDKAGSTLGLRRRALVMMWISGKSASPPGRSAGVTF
jgi:hypothetical protein